jgi:hypothetical protein
VLRREMLLSRLQATLGSFLLAARHSGQPAATHYNTLQHTTTRCNTPQHVATHYNTLIKHHNMLCNSPPKFHQAC